MPGSGFSGHEDGKGMIAPQNQVTPNLETKSMDKKDEEEVDRVEEQTTPRAPVIYETVRRNGEQELSRPPTSLWWSGVAAGVSISFSVLAKAILQQHLPDAPWRDLITALGYPVGFLMVILARQQLFTENTITVVLPVMAGPGWHKIGLAARLWGIVLVANLIGTLIAAAAWTFTPIVSDELREVVLAVSRESVIDHGWRQVLMGAIAAGYLMATMVWLIPGAGNTQFHVVALMSYLIGIGGFSHVVAGSAEAFMLLFNGEIRGGPMVWHFMVPALVGNIFGGTALFAVISHAQVMNERDP